MTYTEAKRAIREADDKLICACSYASKLCDRWRDPFTGNELDCGRCPINLARDFLLRKRKELETDDTLD